MPDYDNFDWLNFTDVPRRYTSGIEPLQWDEGVIHRDMDGNYVYMMWPEEKEETNVLEFKYPYGLTKVLRDDVNSSERRMFTTFIQGDLGLMVRYYTDSIKVFTARGRALQDDFSDDEIEEIKTQIEEKFILLRKLRMIKLTPLTSADMYRHYNRNTHVTEVRLRDELLAKMNIPTFKEGKKSQESQVIPFTDRNQLKGLDVSPLFDTREYDCICQLTGRITSTRVCSFYGKAVQMNPELVKQTGLEIVWVKDLNTYVYKFDPRFELGRARIGWDSGDENDRGDNERLLTYQVSYLTAKGYKYCNGSEDFCCSPSTIMHRPQSFKYSLNYLGLYCNEIWDNTDEDEGVMVGYIDISSPLYARASVERDGTLDYSSNKGRDPGVPFQTQPEKFYGYFSEDKFGELLVTRQPIPQTRYYGCEIELESKSKTDALMMLEDVIPKLLKIGFVSGTDGSLRRGVEFRSCPQTFGVLQSNLKEFFEIVHPYFRAESSCGVHLHVSRSALTDVDILKMHNIVYDENNLNFIEDIAGRSSGEYQEFQSGAPLITDTRTGKKKLNKRACYLQQVGIVQVEGGKRVVKRMQVTKSNKYTAINTNHTHTVEFRLFAGTHNYQQMMVYIEFVDALINFVKAHSISDVSYNKFSMWVRDNAGITYGNLCMFLEPKLKKLTGKIPTFNLEKYMTRRNKKKEKVAA